MVQDPATTHRRRGAAFWRRTIRAHDHSGLTQAYRRNELALSTFLYWRPAVVNGDIALSDLFFDLDDERLKKGLLRKTDLMTVSDYISPFIEPSSESSSE